VGWERVVQENAREKKKVEGEKKEGVTRITKGIRRPTNKGDK